MLYDICKRRGIIKSWSGFLKLPSIYQVWDIRCPKRIEKQFTAHNGPCFSLDWHPEDSSWLASAGRDKIIKVSMNILCMDGAFVYCFQLVCLYIVYSQCACMFCTGGIFVFCVSPADVFVCCI